MLLQITVLVLSAITPSIALPSFGSGDRTFGPIVQNVSQMCGTSEPNPILRQAHAELRALKGQQQKRQTSSTPIVVRTYMHFVSTKDQARYHPPAVRKTMLAQQASVLSTLYRPANISFHVVQTTYTVRDDWATDANGTTMKQALRRGGYSALNLYFQTNLSAYPYTGNALLGYCTLPTSITYGNPPVDYLAADYATDGCSILAASMPKSPFPLHGYNLGKTAVHEVGHWFGLLHTFQDDTCRSGAAGDYCDDTPQQGTSTTGCPVGKDSCPSRPGLDPINNYMDYSTDQCYTNFSPDQRMRMRNMFDLFRKGH